jgi:hypothetical protein
MSLKASGTQIVITNADGSEKFNSENKLVYRKFTQTGSWTAYGGYHSQTDYTLSGSFNPDKDIPLIFVKPTYAQGNIASQVVGSEIQLNFSMLTNFENATLYYGIDSWDMLTAAVLGNSTNAALRIEHLGYARGENYPPVRTLTLDWKLIVLSYR